MSSHFLLFTILISVNALLEAPVEPITKEMKKHLLMGAVTSSSVYNTIGIVNADEEYTSPLVDFMLKYKVNGPVLIGNRMGYYNEHVNVTKTWNLFCFVNEIDDFKSVLEYVQINPFFNMNGYIQFIIGKLVMDKDWLHEVLEYPWSKRILNYVIVFQIKKTVEIVGFNPFSNTYLNFTDVNKNLTFYPDKLINMHRTQLTVGMLIDKPRNFKRFGRLQGRDVNRLRTFAQFVNATYNITILKSFLEIAEAINSGAINFSLCKHFSFPNSPLIIQPSYPIGMEYVFVAVPTANLIPTYLYLFHVFDHTIWISLILSIILMMMLNILHSKIWNDWDTMLIFLTVLRVFLNHSYDYFSKGKWSLRVLMMSYAIFSMVMSAAFNTALRSSLLQPKYDVEIETIDALKKSGIKIAVNTELFQYSGMGNLTLVKDQLIDVNTTEWMVRRMSERNKEMAYVLLKTYLEPIIFRKDSSNHFIYQKLDEFIMAGHSVYNFPKNSPFMEKIEKYVSNEKQYGLSLFGIKPPDEGEESREDNKETQISLQHVQSAFMILGAGYLLGILSFFVELFLQK